MKTIYNIAKAELQNLFFSPIAWLILIIFTFQTGMTFSDSIVGLVRNKSLEFTIMSLTSNVFSGWGGLFAVVEGYLYLYIPLLTMNLMSREYGSGSIKLLYSSPVTNSQIILGKFLSMMIYSLILIGIVMVYVIYAACTIENLDYPLVFTGIMGLYFLMCTYAAIGLFMSSLTSYQVVAAIGTLTILSILNFVKGWWQDVEFIRDITYWLSITGRSNKFISGLICSEDIIYFITVISLFVSMTIIALQSKRQKSSFMTTISKYAIVWGIIICVAYLSSRPTLMCYYDATSTKRNTLTQNSQDIIKKLDGGLEIITYVNLLDKHFWLGMPDRVNEDRRTFEQYIRFKPEIKMKYVYYWDKGFNPSFDERFPNLTDEEKAGKMMEINGYDKKMFLRPEQMSKIEDLSDENYRFVRVLKRDNGEKTFLRVFDDNMIVPGETEISAALKRLVMPLPKVGFVTGHQERNTDNMGDRDYGMITKAKSFRHSMINQGFDFCSISLENEVPSDVTILAIAEMKSNLSDTEKANFDKFVARGGNLIIIGEPSRQEFMNPLVSDLGVKFMDGCLVSPSADFSDDLVITTPTDAACELSHPFNVLRAYRAVVPMMSATGLEYQTNRGFEVTPLFITEAQGCWNELETTNFIDYNSILNSSIGENEKSHTTALALKRYINGREQKIIVIGDADCFSNGELTRSRNNINAFNYYMLMGSFYWLSDGEVPIDVRRPYGTDNDIFVGDVGAKATKVTFVWIIPLILLLSAIVLWIKRRGR